MDKRVLYEQAGATRVHIEAEVTPAGDLVVSGHDIGEGPEKFFGRDDHEYRLAVAAKDVPAFALALLAKHYGGDGMVVSRLRELAEENGIPAEFSSY